MHQGRSIGFVVGSDSAPGGNVIWKVRVKDTSSRHNGMKLIVASVRDELVLAKGLNVNFVIGTIDGPGGEKLLRAVDIQLEIPNDQTQQVNRTKGELNV